MYARNVALDDEKAVTAYLALLEKYPLDPTGLNNVYVSYSALGRTDEADEALRRAIAADVAPVISYTNLIADRLWAGDVREADSVLQLLEERFPGSLEIPRRASNVALARHDWETAEARARELLNASPNQQQWAHSRLAEVAQVHGQMARASQERRERFRIGAQRVGMSVEERDLRMEFDDLGRQLTYALDPTALAPRLDRIWERFRAMTADREPAQRGYGDFIPAFARAGRPVAASELLAEYRAALSEQERADLLTRSSLLRYEGQVALADGRPEDAVGLFRQSCPATPILRSLYTNGSWPSKPTALRRAGPCTHLCTVAWANCAKSVVTARRQSSTTPGSSSCGRMPIPSYSHLLKT
jgi:tetratricopeptide (TPR) repeat protein